MAIIKTLDYLADYYDLEPSLFRESDNLHKLFQSIFSVYHEQQIDLLWFSENILNIDAAENFHLDFIGKLVGQDRFLVGFNAETYFGFDGSYKSDTFGVSGAPYVGGYWNSRSYFNAATARRLSDDEYRRIIKARIISNHSNCSPNDLLEVINLITNRTDNTTQTVQHGVITVKSKDKTGLLSYFVDNIGTKANILPVAAGVRLNLGHIEGEDYFGEEMIEFLNLLEKLVNVDLPMALNEVRGFYGDELGVATSSIESLVNIDLPSAIGDIK